MPVSVSAIGFQRQAHGFPTAFDRLVELPVTPTAYEFQTKGAFARGDYPLAKAIGRNPNEHRSVYIRTTPRLFGPPVNRCTCF